MDSVMNFDESLEELLKGKHFENYKIEYQNLPLISELKKSNFFPEMFIISGESQTYKTTLAVNIIMDLKLSFDNAKFIWIDADFRFPLYLFQQKNMDFSSIDVYRTSSSEDLLFLLHQIEFEITNNKYILNALVIDSLSSTYYIDRAYKSNLAYNIKNMLEKLVKNYGVKVIVVVQQLMKSFVWKDKEDYYSLHIKTSMKTLFKGSIVCKGYKDSFKIDDSGLKWYKRKTV